MKANQRCPKCGSENVLRIVSGLPGPDIMQRTDVYFSGCEVTERDPVWHCGNCNWEWGGDSPGAYNPDEIDAEVPEQPTS